MSLSDFLPDGAIVTQAQAHDWREAVKIAGEALVVQGVITSAYTNEMIKTIEDLGPYIVVAPGFALAHARPSSSVLKTGISWVSLAQPVPFGNKANDPVRLVVGLAAVDHESHLDLMSALADVLADESVFENAIDACTPTAVREILASVATNAG